MRLVLVMLVAIALLLSSDQIAPETKRDCAPFDERARQVLIQALDTALVQHIGKLFAVLLSDNRGQPDRAIVGARKALRSYQNAIAALDKPSC